MKKPMILFTVIAAAVVAAVGGYYLYRRLYVSPSMSTFREWINHPDAHADWAMHPGDRCGDAPFAFPTTGYIGFVWEDSFRPGHRHQGIDIFGGTEPGVTEVFAAYDGYLSRLPDWKSTVIIRIPSDPLKPGRQIWTYYTHMADPNGNSFISEEFPAGTSEVFVKAGTLLGKMGNFSGTPDNPTGVHLHISVVQDDGKGHFKNELKIENTYDPSPYFNLPLNSKAGEITFPIKCKVD
jgi:murein DD-endopeptidase MepM/ murein hydrolase activator NlpD